MKLNSFGEDGRGPDHDVLRNMVLAYREFTGTKAGFHLEYPWWPGQFEGKDEEMEFFLNEYARPDSYEIVAQWHDEAVDKLSETQGELIDVRSSRNLWRVAAVVLLVPYLAIWYLWKTT